MNDQRDDLRGLGRVAVVVTMVLASTLAGACVVDEADELELRKSGPGPSGAEAEVPEVEQDPEVEVPNVPETTKESCTHPHPILANNCEAGIPLGACYTPGNKGSCEVYDCNEEEDQLYRCPGATTLVFDEDEGMLVPRCQPPATWEECTPYPEG